MQRFILTSLIAVCFILCPENAHAQDSDYELVVFQRVDGSYIFGAQVYNDKFMYNPGVSMSFSYGVSVNKYASIGLGSGFQVFDDERFVPVYIDVLGFKKDKKNVPFLNMQVGYSIGWADSYNGIESYDYRGGIYVNAGIGRKIKLNDNFSLMFQCSYRHQSAQMRYKIYEVIDYTHNLNYDMVVITLGIMALQK